MSDRRRATNAARAIFARAAFGPALLWFTLLPMPPVALAQVDANQAKRDRIACERQADERSIAGAERETFLKRCLSAAQRVQQRAQQKARENVRDKCDDQAKLKGLLGEARRKYIAECVKG